MSIEIEHGPWAERRYEDLLFHARMRVVNASCTEYEVRELSLYDDGEGDPLKFKTHEGPDNITSDLELADVFASGSIKFDGCSHNDFGGGGYYHGCQREHLTRIGPLFDRLFDWTVELIGDKGGYLSRGSLV